MFNKLLVASLALCIVSQAWADEPDEKDFPQEEYEHYMKLIAEIDPDAHEVLKQCAIDLDGPCIDRALAGEKDKVVFGTEETEGYPLLVMHSIMDCSLDAQKERLQKLMGAYRKHVAPPMKAAERQKLLHGFKAIDLALYDVIVAVDPTGENHIKRNQKRKGAGGYAAFSSADGLPSFYFDPGLIDDPYEEVLFVLAHELSHYVLGHLFEDPTPVHRKLSEPAPQECRIIKGKKVAGQLPFIETFEKAWSRVEESEADRMAVIDFEIPIDDAICRLKRDMESENPSGTTFQKTHPFSADRIKHLDSLRPEVELRKAQKKQRKKIDYKTLASEYLQEYEE